jgi:hypothetical protein
LQNLAGSRISWKRPGCFQWIGHQQWLCIGGVDAELLLQAAMRFGITCGGRTIRAGRGRARLPDAARTSFSESASSQNVIVKSNGV